MRQYILEIMSIEYRDYNHEYRPRNIHPFQDETKSTLSTTVTIPPTFRSKSFPLNSTQSFVRSRVTSKNVGTDKRVLGIHYCILNGIYYHLIFT